MGIVWVEEVKNNQDIGKTNSIIQVRACVEQLQQQLYDIHKRMDKLNLNDSLRSGQVEDWVNHVQEVVGGLTEDSASRDRPWEL